MISCFENITRYRAGILILALLFCAVLTLAQDTIRPLPRIGDRQVLKATRDSVIIPTAKPTQRPQSVSTTPSPELESSKEHSANTALLLSLLPGAGQIYNGQAWKVPIVYAAIGTMGYLVYSNYSQMSLFKQDYLNRINNGSPLIDEYAAYPNESIYNMYQSYSKNFQLMIIISAGVYALNLVDAYVFGHLYDFQISDDLSMSVTPLLQQSFSTSGGLALSPCLGLTLKF